MFLLGGLKHKRCSINVFWIKDVFLSLLISWIFFKLGKKSIGKKKSWQIISNNYENGTRSKLWKKLKKKIKPNTLRVRIWDIKWGTTSYKLEGKLSNLLTFVTDIMLSKHVFKFSSDIYRTQNFIWKDAKTLRN